MQHSLYQIQSRLMTPSQHLQGSKQQASCMLMLAVNVRGALFDHSANVIEGAGYNHGASCIQRAGMMSFGTILLM